VDLFSGTTGTAAKAGSASPRHDGVGNVRFIATIRMNPRPFFQPCTKVMQVKEKGSFSGIPWQVLVDLLIVSGYFGQRSRTAGGDT
jgi:hypothetical protein